MFLEEALYKFLKGFNKCLAFTDFLLKERFSHCAFSACEWLLNSEAAVSLLDWWWSISLSLVVIPQSRYFLISFVDATLGNVLATISN